MPNPFPGMDPYLEGPTWSTFHNSLIEEIAWQLTPKLRPKYRARSAERVVVAVPDSIEIANLRTRLPDVAVIERFQEAEGGFPRETSSVSCSPLILELQELEETVQPYVEIRTAHEGQLVTAIEVLSPTNKRGEGTAAFQQKRREFLASTAHYLEIDLLRIGERFPVRKPLPSVPYFVFLSRCDRRPHIEAWPIALDAVLPTVPIPLLVGDPDAELDLALAFHTIYEHYEYDRDINYAAGPVVPLSAEQQTWVVERLRATGRS